MTPPATPGDALANALARLAAGVTDRRSPFHTPTLATRDAGGGPNLRTVILRAFDPKARTLRIHTDRRSVKAAELAADPRAMLHAYDAVAQVQVRLRGLARLHGDDALAGAAWASSRDSSRMCYAAVEAPGETVAAPPPAPRDPDAGRGNFVAIVLTIQSLDWLLLDHDGHRRVHAEWDAAGRPTARWIAP